MVVRERRYRHGRLRARFRPGKWQFLDRLPWHLRHDGKRSPWLRVSGSPGLEKLGTDTPVLAPG